MEVDGQKPTPCFRLRVSEAVTAAADPREAVWLLLVLVAGTAYRVLKAAKSQGPGALAAACTIGAFDGCAVEPAGMMYTALGP